MSCSHVKEIVRILNMYIDMFEKVGTKIHCILPRCEGPNCFVVLCLPLTSMLEEATRIWCKQG